MIKPGANADIRREVAWRLFCLRDALGIKTQTQMAQRAGLAQNAYNQWERGERLPNVEDAMKFCEVFGVTLDFIYRGILIGLPTELGMKLVQMQQRRLPVARLDSLQPVTVKPKKA